MIPGRLTGDNQLARWLNQLRESVVEATITSIVGGRFQRGQHGVQLIINAPLGSGGGEAQMFKLKSVQKDYLTARSWDGTTEGTVDTYIAKPYRLRESTAETGYTFTFSGSAPNRIRLKHDDATSDEEYEVVIPIWLVNELVYAIPANTGVKTTNDESSTVQDVALLLVGDSKAWAKATE